MVQESRLGGVGEQRCLLLVACHIPGRTGAMISAIQSETAKRTAIRRRVGRDPKKKGHRQSLLRVFIRRNEHRWIAAFLLLVMAMPAVGPLALASLGEQGVRACCRRRPLTTTAPNAPVQPAMHCHHGASQNASGNFGSQTSGTPQASLRSSDCCCGQKCDCCRNSKTSNWARIAPRPLSFVSLPMATMRASSSVTRAAIFFIGPDSARAPPQLPAQG